MPSESGSLELPHGFRFNAIAAGIKVSGKLDLALIAADQNATASGVYTQNLVRAASIDWCRSITPSHEVRAVLVNSGNANACTGEEGERNNLKLAKLAADSLGCLPQQVIVLSTGIIGKQLQLPLIESKFPDLVQALQSDGPAFLRAADGITTTDNARKVASCRFEVSGQHYSIAIMAKGAGMIGPNMATMLSVAITDFPLEPLAAQQAIKTAADFSFNRISVEGHMSTNDALVLLASGHDEKFGAQSPQFSIFVEQLKQVCLECARLIPCDGEGATHLINIDIRGAESDQAADQIARTIANSALVKTAIYGNDPNWGRIVSAAGYSGVSFDPNQLSLSINDTRIFEHGTPLTFDAAKLSHAMKDNFEVRLQLEVGSGCGVACHLTSDLTIDYVRFNSDYHT